MPIELKQKVAVFTGSCNVEEAETFFEWLLDKPGRTVNFKTCTHIHTAILQVLMYYKPEISVAPAKKQMTWLTTLLQANH